MVRSDFSREEDTEELLDLGVDGTPDGSDFYRIEGIITGYRSAGVDRTADDGDVESENGRGETPSDQL